MRLRKQAENGIREGERRALAAIDAAMDDHGDAPEPLVTDEHSRELVRLAVELRRRRPRPSAEFAGQMEERLKAGFAPKERRAKEIRAEKRLVGFRRRFRPLSAIALAASLLIALSVAVTLIGNPLQDGGPKQVAQPPQTVEPETPGRMKQAPDAGAGAAPGGILEGQPVLRSESKSGSRPRRVEASALITLATSRDGIQDVTDEIIQTTDRHRGIVMRSEITTDSDTSEGATFELRVPIGQLRATLADLSQLGNVVSRTQSTTDVTGNFNSTRERLGVLRAERASLLLRIAASDSARKTARLREELRQVTAQIHSAKSQLDNLRQRTAYSRIDVALKSDSGESGGGDSGWGVSDAARDSLYFTVQAANFAIRALGILIPLLIVAGGTFWLGRAVLRHRRTAPLRDSGENADHGA